MTLYAYICSVFHGIRFKVNKGLGTQRSPFFLPVGSDAAYLRHNFIQEQFLTHRTAHSMPASGTPSFYTHCCMRSSAWRILACCIFYKTGSVPSCKQPAIMHWQSKVETQNLASHEQVCAIKWGEYMPAIAAFFPRETQVWAIKWWEYMLVFAAIFPRETQNFASLQGWRHRCFAYDTPSYLPVHCPEVRMWWRAMLKNRFYYY